MTMEIDALHQGQPMRNSLDPCNTCADYQKLAAENERLRVALRFYARGNHYHLDAVEEFDSVSGEPDNWLCSGLDNSETMVENGRVAQWALQDKRLDWMDGEDDETPQPIEGEVTCAT